ncbi:MAG: hypothetical protein D6788_05760 [Planctomycetota bacterium]|nr:MAG: hypothetical protein D6788_05760 [Planctomycetota bacterium]
MSAQRKRVYLTLLAIGAVALLVDRLVLLPRRHGPAPVFGGVLPVQPDASTTQATSAPVEDWVPLIPFPSGVESLAEDASMRDLFQAPEGIDPAPTRTNTMTEAKAPSPSASFQEVHRLTGVLVGESVRGALVDGRWVRVGELVSGCELSNVTGTHAVFTCPDGTVTLSLADETGKIRN